MARVLDFPGCSVGATLTPNDDPFADDEISIIAHEVEETNTDPQVNAWYDSYQGHTYENADKCQDDFGTTYTTANGATANMNIAGKDFLVQQNWEFGTYQGCATRFAVTALSVYPNPAPVCLNGATPLTAIATDVVGNVWTGGTVAWSSSNTSVATATSTGSRSANAVGVANGQVTITATLDGATGQSTVTVGPCPSVTISGPTTVRPGATCLWWANVSGGTPPYNSYAWSPPGDNTSDLTYTNSGQDFTVSVSVTDATGHSGYASRSVTVSSSAPICKF